MKKEKIGSNPILKLTFDFSVEIRDYCDRLNKFKKYTISAQLLEPATFIGANCKEAQHAESRADFIHTIKIAAKERKNPDIGFFFAIFPVNTRNLIRFI